MESLRIAVRYLLSRKSMGAVNVISRISVAGVAVATAATLCVLSVFNGFSQLAASRLSKLDPPLRIVPAQGKIIADADSLAAVIGAVEGVACAMPVVEERALAVYDGRQMPVTLMGVSDSFGEQSGIDDIIIDGSYMQADGDYSCATLSVGSAISLAARPGFRAMLRLYAPRRRGRINQANPMASFRADSLIVAGVYELEQSEYDADRVIVPVDVARRLLDYTSEATSIAVAVSPGSDLRGVESRLRAMAGDRLIVKDRLQQQQQSFRMIAVEKWITFVMLAFIVVVASFNVVSTMSMLIIEKRSNIATMSAMGATPRMIRGIFMWESWLISLSGGVAGLLLGIALCLAQEWGGFIRLGGDPSQLSVTVYPVALSVYDVLTVFVMTVAVGIIIGWIATRGISVDPVDD